MPKPSKPAGRPSVDPHSFIADNTRLRPVPSLPQINLHAAHEATGLWRLAASSFDDGEPPPPYWAFPWAGGLALARYLLDNPDIVAGRRVLDLGCGSGLVAIAAAKSGARSVIAADIDAFAIAATELNAKANGVSVKVVANDLLTGAPPDVDLIAVGDLFYERDLADRVTAFLQRCLADGLEVIVGDPGRTYLPRSRLKAVAEYIVPDVGEVESATTKPSMVFTFLPT